jgi:hypothetical protein
MSAGYVINTASYWEEASGRINYFELSNTPISNFKHQSTAHEIVINGVSVNPAQIRKIVFGESYNGVTDAGDYFCAHMGPTVTEIILPKNLTTIGYGFMASFKGDSVRLPSSLTSIGGILLSGSAIRSLYIGSLDIDAVTNKSSGFSGISSSGATPKIIYADTPELGIAFRGWYTSLRNWTVDGE